MVYLKGFNPETIHVDRLFRLGKLQTINGKRQLRCNDPQRCHDLAQTLRSHQKKRLCPFCISHREKHSRKSADMVCMKMGKADDIDRFGAPPLFLHCDLGSFPTVHQDTCPIISCHHGCKPSIWERHHSACSQ